VQDTGVIQAISQAPQTIGSRAMAEKQLELTKAVLADPAVDSVSSFIGADGTNTTTNSGRMSINLKPIEQRHISGLRPHPPAQFQSQPGAGNPTVHATVQNITVDDRVSRTQYQFTLEDPDANELNDWTNRFVERLKQLPGTGRCGHRSANWRLGGSAGDRPASRLRALVSLRPPSITRSTMPSVSARSVPCTPR